MVVANAPGCSSIFGGNLPTTPWTTNKNGQGPAWANSLFEDNAEFGLGIKLASDKKRETAVALLHQLRVEVGEELADAILNTGEETESEKITKHTLIAELKHRLTGLPSIAAQNLLHLCDFLGDKSIWII